MNINDQLPWVKHHLKSNGLTNKNLLEEYTDHYMHVLEAQISSGQNILNAQAYTLLQINAQDFKIINRQYFFLNHKNQIIMTSILFCLLSIFSFLHFPTSSDFELDPPSIWPVKANTSDIHSAFGMRLHPTSKTRKQHKGVDFRLPAGTEIFATASGLVIKVAKHKSGYGHHVLIDHGDGYQTLYAHMKDITVEENQKLKVGTIIGTVGSTGMSTAPHLHYEVLKDGKAVDPMTYLVP